MSFDPTKPVQTRDGRMARIICTNRHGKYPIVALVTVDNNIEKRVIYTAGGSCLCDCFEDNYDLINIPTEPQYAYINVYKNMKGKLGAGQSWASRKDADDSDEPSERVSCIRVELKEGQFDE